MCAQAVSWPASSAAKSPARSRASSGVAAGLADAVVARGEDGDDLLDGRRLALRELDLELVRDHALVAAQPPLGRRAPGRRACVARGGTRRRALAANEDSRPRRLGDAHVRLHRLDARQQGLAVGLLQAEHVEVPARELPVPRDTPVRHRRVDAGAHAQTARPVLGDDRRLQGGEVGEGHVHEAALDAARRAALAVAEAGAAREDPAAQVELLPVVEQLDRGHVEPGSVADRQLQHEPVRDVDDGFVHDRLAGDLGVEAIVDSGGVGAGVVHVVGGRLGRRPARRHVAVAQRAERLAEPFGLRVEALVRPYPWIHASPYCRSCRPDVRAAVSLRVIP